MPGAWEQMPFLAMCTLTRETVNFKWAAAVRDLVLPPRSQHLYTSGMPFDAGRNSVAAQALSVGCEWVFFLDDDVIAPADTVARLMRHGKKICSGLYFRRSPPLAPVAMQLERESGMPKWIPIPKADAGLIQCDYVGAGCLLIHRSVFEKLPKPWFKWQADNESLPPNQRISEDFHFCKGARFAGFNLWLDPSCRCGHIGYAVSQEGGLLP